MHLIWKKTFELTKNLSWSKKYQSLMQRSRLRDKFLTYPSEENKFSHTNQRRNFVSRYHIRKKGNIVAALIRKISLTKFFFGELFIQFSLIRLSLWKKKKLSETDGIISKDVKIVKILNDFFLNVLKIYNHRQNTWNKIKKSSKTAQKQKTLTAILEGRLGTRLYLHPILILS